MKRIFFLKKKRVWKCASGNNKRYYLPRCYSGDRVAPLRKKMSSLFRLLRLAHIDVKVSKSSLVFLIILPVDVRFILIFGLQWECYYYLFFNLWFTVQIQVYLVYRENVTIICVFIFAHILTASWEGVGKCMIQEAKEETERILRKARRQKRKYRNPIIINWR